MVIDVYSDISENRRFRRKASPTIFLRAKKQVGVAFVLLSQEPHTTNLIVSKLAVEFDEFPVRNTCSLEILMSTFGLLHAKQLYPEVCIRVHTDLPLEQFEVLVAKQSYVNQFGNLFEGVEVEKGDVRSQWAYKQCHRLCRALNGISGHAYPDLKELKLEPEAAVFDRLVVSPFCVCG